jgi:hypothetical protein
MSTSFSFLPNRSICGLDPQAVGEELERLRTTHGALTPTVVVEAARDEESPLHAGFEWDDGVAAEQFRLSQARKIVISIRCNNHSPANQKVPYFVSVRTPEAGRSYVPTSEAMSDDQLRFRVMNEIRTFIESLERKYSNFSTIAELIDAMKKNVG